jgi:hypothetical protein
VVDSEINTYLKKSPVCPASGAYVFNVVGTDPTCNITDADSTLNHVLP